MLGNQQKKGMNLLVFEQLTFILPVICIGNQGILQFKKANKDSSPGKSRYHTPANKGIPL